MNNLYSAVVRGNYSIVIEQAEPDIYSICCKSLALAQIGRLQDAAAKLNVLALENLNSQERSIYLEAKALIAYKSRNKTQAKELAESAISLNQSAIIAHTILGRFAEEKRLFLTALNHFEAIVEVYPDYEAALFACTRMLLFSNQKQQALSYLKRTPSSGKKTLYNLFITIYFRGILLTLPFVLGMAILMYLPYCYYLLTFLLVLGYLMVLRYFNADGFLLRAIIVTEILATVFFLVT